VNFESSAQFARATRAAQKDFNARHFRPVNDPYLTMSLNMRPPSPALSSISWRRVTFTWP